MSRFARHGALLEAHLQAVVVRWRDLRGLLLVDGGGLPLASTLHARSLEERMSALATLGMSLMDRAQGEIETGPVHLLHLAAQDRQFFVVPVQEDVALVAIAEPDAGVADLERMLLSAARDLLALLDSTHKVTPPVSSED